MKDENKRVRSTNRRRIGNLCPSGSVVEDGLYYTTESMPEGRWSWLRGAAICGSAGGLNGLLQTLNCTLEVRS
jgi:hypothetical protein